MITYIALFFIGLFAFFLKGLMGVGPTSALVSLGVLFIDPKLAVVLASVINMVSGLVMLRVDPVPLPRRYWLPVALTMVIGSVAGAWSLKVIQADSFELILGLVFLGTAFYFLRQSLPRVRQNGSLPSQASIIDSAVGLFSGFCGGFIGVNAPPLLLHFGRFLDKQHLRRMLVLIFIPAALAQTATFSWNGLLTFQVMRWAAVLLPAMLMGIYLGNKAFGYVSETAFRKILGALLIVVSFRLIWPHLH